MALEKHAVDLAQKQLDAYNEKNIEEFLRVYSDEVEILEFPTNNIMYKGINQMRERYTKLFEKNPNQYAELRERITYKNIVIDHEFVTGRANGINVEAVAMYEVTNDKISKVWFVK